MNSALAPKYVRTSQTFWTLRREASLNWLALGLLLAAWNVSDDSPGKPRPRPESLRGYPYVSVRAVHRYEDGSNWYESVPNGMVLVNAKFHVTFQR